MIRVPILIPMYRNFRYAIKPKQQAKGEENPIAVFKPLSAGGIPQAELIKMLTLETLNGGGAV